MAENNITELTDDELQQATGGKRSGLSVSGYKEGDHVKVKGYEKFDAVVAEVKNNNDGNRSLFCVVHIFHTLGTIIYNETVDNLMPAE